MKCRFKLTDIRLAWSKIKQPVIDVVERLDLEWRPEDLYASCLYGNAFCYICEHGFIIVKPRENPFNLKKELFLWLAIGWSGEDLITEYYEDISYIARDVYCTEIVFDSPRLAFHKLAKQNNWSMMTSYKVPVL